MDWAGARTAYDFKAGPAVRVWRSSPTFLTFSDLRKSRVPIQQRDQVRLCRHLIMDLPFHCVIT
jgi:hypothetical protein